MPREVRVIYVWKNPIIQGILLMNWINWTTVWRYLVLLWLISIETAAFNQCGREIVRLLLPIASLCVCVCCRLYFHAVPQCGRWWCWRSSVRRLGSSSVKSRTITTFLLQRADFYHWTHRRGSRPDHWPLRCWFPFYPSGRSSTCFGALMLIVLSLCYTTTAISHNSQGVSIYLRALVIVRNSSES